MTALAETYRSASSAEGGGTIEELEPEAFAATSAGDGWIPGAGLLDGDPSAYDRLRRAAIAFTGEVDAKTIGLAMAWAAGPVIAPPLAAYLADRRVPDLGLADVAFRPYGDTPEASATRPVPFACLPDDVAIEVDPRARPVADAEALRARLMVVLEGLIEPLAVRLNATTTIALGAVWGLAAGSIAYALAEKAAGTGSLEAAVAEAEAAFDHAPRLGRRRPGLFVFDSPGGPWVGLKGSVCCRAYKWEGRDAELCLSCPIRDDESRLAGLRSWRASLAGED